MLRFYSELGLAFDTVSVRQGTQYFRSFIGTIEFMIYEVSKDLKSKYPACQFTFEVQNLLEIVAKLNVVEGVTIILDPTLMPDGHKCILTDPDGHSVELVEK